jgi:DNA-binding MarR family transcriptional regulator
MPDVKKNKSILDTFMLFVQTSRIVAKYTDAFLYRQAHLSPVKLIVLKALDKSNGTMTPSEIAKWTQTERHNITTLVRRMIKDGLITAERSKTNRKFVNVTITDTGRKVLAETLPIAQEAVDRVMASISDSSASEMAKNLQVMKQNSDDAFNEITGHAEKIAS